MSFERTHPPLVPGVNRPPPDPVETAGYRLLEAEARSLHASAHSDWCWCTDKQGDEFVRELYERCLEPAGFQESLDDRQAGILIVDGPGISDERTTELYEAVRGCGE
jgi:hypothetical protein